MLVNFVGDAQKIEFLRDFRYALKLGLRHHFARRIGRRADDNRFKGKFGAVF